MAFTPTGALLIYIFLHDIYLLVCHVDHLPSSLKRLHLFYTYSTFLLCVVDKLLILSNPTILPQLLMLLT
jgi:hypothetical protein